MFLPNPGVLAAGAGVATKTYAEFEAHLSSLGFNAYVDWDSNSANTGAIGVRANNMNLTGYAMFGSPWMGLYRITSIICRVAQHALPSEAAFNDQRLNERLLRLTVEAAPNSSVLSVTRNGYTSLTASTGFVSRCTEVLAWIDGQPMRMRPNLGLGPEPYDW